MFERLNCTPFFFANIKAFSFVIIFSLYEYNIINSVKELNKNIIFYMLFLPKIIG